MAEISASPVRSKSLKRIAEVLADLQGPMGQVIPGTDINPFKLLPAASSVENWAYGNSPFSDYPSVTNRRLPVVKTGRQGEVGDIANTALMATGVPAASRGVTRGANVLGDVLTQMVTRNPAATSIGVLEEAGNLAPLANIAKFKGIPLTELLYPGRAASSLTSAEKSAITRFEKTLKNPAVRRREEMALAGGDVVTPTPGLNLIKEIAINPEQLLGKRLVPVTGDLSTVGGDVRQIAGVPLSTPVVQQGGRLYPTIEQNVRQGVAWASEPSSASGKVANLNKFANQGDDTVGVFVGMSPQGINFSHHVAEAMVRQLPELKVSKDAIRQLNAEIRNSVDKQTGKAKFKNFAGVDSPNIEELMSQGTKDFSAGDLRKIIVEKMGKAEYKNMGFPDYEKAVKVMTEPGLFQGEAGRTMFAAQPNSKMITPDFEHRSYSAGIPGQYMGGIASPTGGTTGVPRALLFPKLFADFEKRKTPETGINRSLMMAHHGEVFDQEALDRLMAYLNQAPAQ